jgi:hypothetical protein
MAWDRHTESPTDHDGAAVRLVPLLSRRDYSFRLQAGYLAVLSEACREDDCVLVEIDRHFRDAYCLNHQGVMMKSVNISETSANFIRLHGSTSQKTVNFTLAAEDLKSHLDLSRFSLVHGVECRDGFIKQVREGTLKIFNHSTLEYFPSFNDT